MRPRPQAQGDGTSIIGVLSHVGRGPEGSAFSPLDKSHDGRRPGHLQLAKPQLHRGFPYEILANLTWGNSGTRS